MKPKKIQSKFFSSLFMAMPTMENSGGDITKNSQATVSLILGIISLVAWSIPIIGAPISIIGLIFGIKGLKSLKRRVAISGIVLAIIGLLATIINSSIGAYQGTTGKNYFANKFLNQERRETDNDIAQSAQPTTPPPSSTIPDILEQRAYVNVQHGFKINPPKSWREDEGGQFGAIVFFFNTKTDQEGTDPFSANINITSEPTQGFDLDSYVSATRDLLPKLLQNYQSTENKKITLNGMQIQLIGGTFVQGVFHLRNLQLITVKNEQAYVVTGTVLESTWNKYDDLIESSLLTFEVN